MKGLNNDHRLNYFKMVYSQSLRRQRRVRIVSIVIIASIIFWVALSRGKPICSERLEIKYPPKSLNCPLLPQSRQSKAHSQDKRASALSPAELLCRAKPLGTGIPKLLHQSWKSSELPIKFEQWSDSCRRQHPDWEWVLWTDEDNLRLIKSYTPWLVDTYLSLPSNIYRADLARNVYMYIFGGVYADLDTECLRPIVDSIAAYNPSVLPHSGHDSSRSAIFGRMGSNESFAHHIPNAWMAASHSHPFFLRPLRFAQAEVKKSRSLLHRLWYDYPSPEQWTGPIALQENIAQYAASCNATSDPVFLLPGHMVYPFDWSIEENRDFCSAESDSFNSSSCKESLNVLEKGSISITYWSHTHRGKGVDEDNIARINKGNLV